MKSLKITKMQHENSYLEILVQPIFNCKNFIRMNSDDEQDLTDNTNFKGKNNHPYPQLKVTSLSHLTHLGSIALINFNFSFKLHNLNNELLDHNGKILIEVSLLSITNSDPQICSNYKLKSKSNLNVNNNIYRDVKLNDSCCYYLFNNYDTMSINIDNLYITPNNQNQSENLLKLKFNAIIVKDNFIDYICEPIYSDIIELNGNETTDPLRIIRLVILCLSKSLTYFLVFNA